MTKDRDIYLENAPVAQALERWRRALSTHGDPLLPAESVAVDDARGRVTSGPVHARRSWPFYPAAAMDGIAVRYRETLGATEARPVRLRFPAGYRPVNTGHALPEGFDAVVMIEEVYQAEPETVELIAAATPWQHVRTIGEDLVAGELIVPRGHRIRPPDMAAMLATGVERVDVRRRPRAVVIPTGSEVVQPGQPLHAGNIIEFNGRMLTGLLEQWGVAADRHEVVPDDPAALREALARAAERYDVIVVNAGASAGTEDFTAAVVAELGEVVVHGVDIKPGKPVILGRVGRKPLLGLPGYPVSAVVTLRLFGRELIETLLGTRLDREPVVEAVSARPVPSKMGVNEFVRMKLGRVGDRLVATPAGRGAGAVMSLVQSDGILTVPAGSEGVGAGETVRIELLRDLAEVENTLVFIGSHDNTLDVLADLLAARRPRVRLSSAHVGSMGGIMALHRGEAHIAGTHLLDEKTGEYNVPFLKRYLPGIPVRLITLAHREQGLYLPPGNPKGLGGFEDLVREDIAFINRQRGAGTRLLTDHHLAALGVDSRRIRGYDREEYTHMGVAAAVASGSADTGLGIRAAAVALGLDFLPVAKERYDIIVPRAHEKDPRVEALLELLRTSADFRREVAALGGYDLSDCGRVVFET